ncbi:VanZ family protein (plasmid) [Cytobacillus solani]|uniref:VanZ family protein n=1 Tax=Cytobacillus solani TaxID=1637975 RepID=UPI002079848C|nr:VanZ family protein [Cytobacillus solani]USK57812.1 VanZ family protein [Cytobacillus solani]
MLIDFDLLSYLIGLLILSGLIFLLKKKYKKSNMYILFYTIFFVYILNVIKYTIFPIEIGTLFVEELKEQLSTFSRTNVIPFKFQNFEQTFLNILLTIPFGFGLPYLKKVNIKSALLLGILFSFLIESTQFIISLVIGYPYRVTDINDILANSIGVIVGYLLFKLFSKVAFFVLHNIKKADNKLNPFLNYIYQIAKEN